MQNINRNTALNFYVLGNCNVDLHHFPLQWVIFVRIGGGFNVKICWHPSCAYSNLNELNTELQYELYWQRGWWREVWKGSTAGCQRSEEKTYTTEINIKFQAAQGNMLDGVGDCRNIVNSWQHCSYFDVYLHYCILTYLDIFIFVWSNLVWSGVTFWACEKRLSSFLQRVQEWQLPLMTS